ncbi:hypothetical protein [Halanaeroarchaeum sulfurireducens]|uniref:DUF7981 domain-containing protein n=1 Tax=Halanaeroarchaeum sulfurireducens TaxID=1604004 RepID=A0A0F7P7R5_9EURY|nr:hypothetical protein [Halanaeroarchaeum sulfurireducens]AKH96747.1 hypothetical protein HLASF_0236 [Halanaeroarchaeum sulfurireducens]ALG81149.1 hypothetical protein HLASA_0236 [Halanaeroarchaeum sulfurireducens]
MSGRREHLLRGLVGALSFLVLVQGYRLLSGRGPSLPVLLGVAVVVWAVGSAGSALLDAWLAEKRRV